MKFHIAFVLLVIFGVAQAGEKHIASTFGSGLGKYDEKEDLLMEGGDQTPVGAVAQTFLSAATENTERASEKFGATSDAHYNYAELFTEFTRRKAECTQYQQMQARNDAAKANESYKKAQLHKRQAKDKQAISKEYEERAQKNERKSKELDTKLTDAERKVVLEFEEHKESLAKANMEIVRARNLYDIAEFIENESNDCEQHAKALSTRAGEYKKIAETYKEKAEKEKELAGLENAKSKEFAAKYREMENQFIESSKKLHELKHFVLEFLLKEVNYRHHAEYARARSHYFKQMATKSKHHHTAMHHFLKAESDDARSFHTFALQCNKEKNALTTGAAHLLKQHRYTGSQIYSKQQYPYANYHEE